MKLTREKELELRKHIKPYLRYAIKKLKSKYYNRWLCNLAFEYSKGNKEIELYLIKRIDDARPIDSGKTPAWYSDNFYTYDDKYKKRIDFCKQQLKIVDENQTFYS